MIVAGSQTLDLLVDGVVVDTDHGHLAVVAAFGPHGEPVQRCALPVSLDQQHLVAIFGQGDRQVGCQGGLAGAAFLRDNRDPHPPPHRN